MGRKLIKEAYEFLAVLGATFYILLCPVFVLSLVYSIKKVNEKRKDDAPWELKGLLLACIVSMILLVAPIMYHCIA